MPQTTLSCKVSAVNGNSKNSHGHGRIGTRFSKNRGLCPICHKDGCSATDDGLHFCLRSSGYVAGWTYFGQAKRDSSWGQYRRDDDAHTPYASDPAPRQSIGASDYDREKEQEKRRADKEGWQRTSYASYVKGAAQSWRPLMDAAAETEIPGVSAVELLSRRLGVPTFAFQHLTAWHVVNRCGDHGEGRESLFAFAMVDENGQEIGRSIRRPDGSKKTITNSHNGLYVPTNILDGNGPIYVVEGASDAATLSGMGLRVIGRPSNASGGDLLAAWVGKHLPPSRWDSLIIIAENDHKPDGRCPGLWGAWSVAQRVAELLGEVVHVAATPDGAKDAREWFRASAEEHGGVNIGPAAAKSLGKEFADRIRSASEPMKPGGQLPSKIDVWKSGVSAPAAVDAAVDAAPKTDLADFLSSLCQFAPSESYFPGSIESGRVDDPRPGKRAAAEAEANAALDGDEYFNQSSYEMPACYRARVRLCLKSNKDEKTILGLACLQPSCETCLPAVQRMAIKRFGYHLKRLGDAPVYISRITAKFWKAKRLSDAAGQYGRVIEKLHGVFSSADATYLVVSTRPLPGSTEVSTEAAIAAVAKAVRAVHSSVADFSDFHPFAFCRDWHPLLNEGSGKYVRDDEMPPISRDASMRDLEGIIDRYCESYESSIRRVDESSRYFIRFTAPKDQELRKKLFLALQIGDADLAEVMYAESKADEEARKAAEAKRAAEQLLADLGLDAEPGSLEADLAPIILGYG